MSKALIMPIVAMVALILQLTFGLRLAEDQLEVITNGLVALSLAVMTVVGFIKKKEDK